MKRKTMIASAVAAVLLMTNIFAQDVPLPSGTDDVTKQQLLSVINGQVGNINRLADAIIAQQATINNAIAANVQPIPEKPATTVVVKDVLPDPVVTLTTKTTPIPSKAVPTWFVQKSRSMTYSRMAMVSHLTGPPHNYDRKWLQTLSIGQLWHIHDTDHENELNSNSNVTTTTWTPVVSVDVPGPGGSGSGDNCPGGVCRGNRSQGWSPVRNVFRRFRR